MKWPFHESVHDTAKLKTILDAIETIIGNAVEGVGVNMKDLVKAKSVMIDCMDYSQSTALHKAGSCHSPTPQFTNWF